MELTATTTTSQSSTGPVPHLGGGSSSCHLPYVESVHEDYEEYALSLIEEEMGKLRSPPPSQDPVPPVRFRTSLMERSYQDVVAVAGTIPSSSSSSRTTNEYQPPKVVPATSVKEWTKHTIPLLKARFEGERIRSLTLEVEKDEAVSNWKDYNALLDAVRAQWELSVQEQAMTVEEVNFQRQQVQTQQFGPELDRLEREYHEVLYRRNQLEHAIEGLRRQQQQEQLRKRKGGPDATTTTL